MRAWLAGIFALTTDALYPSFDAELALRALLPLAALAAPAVPLARLLGRRGAVAAAVALVCVARVPLTVGPLPARAVAASLVVAGGGLLLACVVGWVERRGVASALVGAMLLDQLLRLAGSSWDLSMRPLWVPVQLVLSLLTLALLATWLRVPAGEDGEGFERRAGGLRLRGGLVLGLALFLDGAVLSSAAAVSRLAAIPFDAAGVLLVSAGAVALALTLHGVEARDRHRPADALLALLAGGGAALGWAMDGWGVAAAMAVAHFAALLLLNRAVSPAGGRRPSAAVVPGLLLMVGFHAVLAATWFPAHTHHLLGGAAPWVLLAAGVLLAATLLLLPRAEAAPPLAPGSAAVLLPLAATAAAVAVAWVLSSVDGRATPASPEARARDGGLVVATYNVHMGFDERWAHDPEAIARALERSGAAVMGLQEVPAGLPFVYGVDLALWLGRRLGARDYLAPAGGELLGDAFLVHGGAGGFRAGSLGGADPRQSAVLRLPWNGDSLSIHVTRLGQDAGERARQVRTLVSRVAAGPAVVLGDFNAEGADPELAPLAEAGFRDAAALAGADPDPTFPAAAPERRIDWIWVREVAVLRWEVPDEHASDHRPVVAALAPR